MSLTIDSLYKFGFSKERIGSVKTFASTYKTLKYFELTEKEKTDHPEIEKYLKEYPITTGYYDQDNKFISFTPEKEYTFQELQREFDIHNQFIIKRKEIKEKENLLRSMPGYKKEDLVRYKVEKECEQKN